MERSAALRIVLGGLLLLLVLVACGSDGLGSLDEPSALAAESESPGDLEEWAVPPGFSLDVDADGFELPSAIAFVPDPGDAPDDPLYFVTELRGDVKVVTNDRTVHDFATVSAFVTEAELPAGAAQAGMAGICLAPESGYVLVTYAAEDDNGILRNNVTRFETTPRTFSLTPTAQVDFGEIFAPYQSAVSHQIGDCDVLGEDVFIGIGDAGNPTAAGQLGELLGKVVCITTAGTPCSQNPYLAESEPTGPESYVWARGLRNPFGVNSAGGELFVADNGIDIDRFLRVEGGGDYLWNGSDQSLASAADVVFLEPISPVQMDFAPAGSDVLPEEYGDHFFIAASGSFDATDDRGLEGVAALGYDPTQRTVLGPPEPFVEYGGATAQGVTGLAVGPDGLYFVPILPDARGRSAVLKLSFDPENQHSVVIGAAAASDEAAVLLDEKGCLGCHQIGGVGGTVGPAIDPFALRFRLRERVLSEAYEAQVRELDGLADEPFVSYRDERQRLLDASGDERLRLWIEYKLLEPKFDNPQAQMPNLELTEEEAVAITDHLLQDLEAPSILDRIRANKKPFGAGFVTGVVLSFAFLVLLAGSWWLVRRLRRNRRSDPAAV